MVEAFIGALGFMAQPGVVTVIVLGCAIGFVFGLIPGLGSVQALALVLPFTFGWDPMTAMFLYAGIMGSTSEGGSISAILLNTPGSVVNAATCFDGYPMTRRGEAGRALGLAAASSSLGALFGIVVLVLLIPVVRPIVLAFGPPEFFWLVLFGLVTITFAARGNLFKGLATGGVGILISLVGYSDVFGVLRWTGGSEFLWDGLELVPFFIGIFAVSELIVYATRGGTIATSKREKLVVGGLREVYRGAKEMFRYPITFLRGSAIGTIIGIIPGVGGAVANFISYTTAMQSSKNRALFGTGHPEGIVASESANDAKDGGALLPTVAFGIPGSAEMAVLLGALTLHGIQPGPLVIRQHMDVVMALILGLVASNLMAGLLLFFLANVLARLAFTPVHYIAPVVAVLAAVGSFALRSNVWDIALAFSAGVLGFGLKRFGFPVVTLAIGYILGVIAERAFHQSLMIAFGSYSVFFTRPISLVLTALIIVILVVPFLRASRKVDSMRKSLTGKPFNRGSFLFTLAFFLLVLAMVAVAFTYEANVRLIPLMVGIPTLLLLLVNLCAECFPETLRALEVGIEDLWGGSLPETSGEQPAEDVSESIRWIRAVAIIGWITVFFVLALLAGFLISIPLFLFAFLLIEGKIRWPLSLGVAGAVWIVVYLVFERAFMLDLWPGAITEIIPGVIGGGILPPL
jgi:putative tricarboxylic transport membrane protein